MLQSSVFLYCHKHGEGYWKKTDPRLDQQRISKINQKYSGRILNIIRVIKYWNRYVKMPSIPSYLLESIILDYYENNGEGITQHINSEIPKILNHMSTSILTSINDPKNIQGNINNLSDSDKNKISTVSYRDYQKAEEANELNEEGYVKEAVNIWREIFGEKFPEVE